MKKHEFEVLVDSLKRMAVAEYKLTLVEAAAPAKVETPVAVEAEPVTLDIEIPAVKGEDVPFKARAETSEDLARLDTSIGEAVPGDQTTWELPRGLKTFEERMKFHSLAASALPTRDMDITPVWVLAHALGYGKDMTLDEMSDLLPVLGTYMVGSPAFQYTGKVRDVTHIKEVESKVKPKPAPIQSPAPAPAPAPMATARPPFKPQFPSPFAPPVQAPVIKEAVPLPFMIPFANAPKEVIEPMQPITPAAAPVRAQSPITGRYPGSISGKPF